MISDVFYINIAIFARKRETMKDYSDRMTAEQARAFGEDVLNIVSQIPRGKVTTYGHIAALAGWPSHARMVGRTLRYSPKAVELPCHRVVNIAGRTAPGWSRQRTLLEEEGVRFKANGHVDMERHLWEPEVM
jgi:methylated-DNA-protein-cysteine methyltransferase-like protein